VIAPQPILHVFEYSDFADVGQAKELKFLSMSALNGRQVRNRIPNGEDHLKKEKQLFFVT